MIIFAKDTRDSKVAARSLGHRMSATYAPIDNTCPSTCELKKDHTCYARGGQVGMHEQRIALQSVGMSALMIAREEERAVVTSFRGGPIPQDGGRGGRDLRFHISGDARTAAAARLLGKAATDWKARGGGRVYTYTHAGLQVPRSAWGPDVSVLGSVDSHLDIAAVRAQGYAPTLVVPYHESHKTITIGRGRTKFTPCPSQTSDVACSQCGLCMDGDRLHKENRGIGFAAHGLRTKKLIRRLTVVNQ